MTQPAANDPLLLPLTPAVDAHLALANLGLTVELVHAALRSGEQAAASVTPYHPRIAAGMERWISTVTALRQGLIEKHKWKKQELQNSPRVIRPDGKLSVMVIGGTSGTGRESGRPSTKNKRGPTAEGAVDGNQLALPLDISLPIAGTSAEEILTWVLLYHRAKDPNETRAELSLPSKIANDRIVDWKYRIIIPPISHDFPLPPDVDGDGDIDFPILSRGR